MKKFIIDLIKEIIQMAFKAILTANRTVVNGVKGEWELKLKNKAKADGWNKDNAKLCLALALLFFNACAPAAIVLQHGQSVMLAQDKKAKCFVLAEDGSKYKTTVRLKAGWLCGAVDFN